jgi:hypothetical protein
VVAVLGGTTALAASHRSAAAPNAAQSEAADDHQGEHQDSGPAAKTAQSEAAGDQQGEHQDNGPAAKTAVNGATPSSGSNFEGGFQGEQ